VASCQTRQMETLSLSRHLAEAARELQSETGSQHTVDRVVELAVRLVRGAEEAGSSMVEAGGVVTTPVRRPGP
jgi:hypothetical protein